MKAMLFTLILGVSLLVVALGTALFLAPKQITHRQVIKVGTDAPRVYHCLRSFEQYPNWSVWKEQDPSQTHQVTGRDGHLGCQFSWKGQESGRGYQTLTSLIPMQKIGIDVTIEEPFQASPQFSYSLRDVGNGQTEVVQDFVLPLQRPMNVIAWVLGLKDKTAASNQRSLELLKNYLELRASQESAVSQFQVAAN